MAAEVDRIADIYCCFHPRPQVLDDRSNNLLNNMMEGGSQGGNGINQDPGGRGGGREGTRRSQQERTWQIAFIYVRMSWGERSRVLISRVQKSKG